MTPATLGLAAQCVNLLRNRAPYYYCVVIIIITIIVSNGSRNTITTLNKVKN